MLREQTLEKLHALRVRIMAATWLEQDKFPDSRPRQALNEGT